MTESAALGLACDGWCAMRRAAGPSRVCSLGLPCLAVIAAIDELALAALPELWKGGVRDALVAFFLASCVIVLVGTPLCDRLGLLSLRGGKFPEDLPARRGTPEPSRGVTAAESMAVVGYPARTIARECGVSLELARCLVADAAAEHRRARTSVPRRMFGRASHG
jgi:hypothetical protein